MPYIKVVQVSGGANECGATYQPAVIDGRIDAPKNVDRPIWEWICWWQRSRQNKVDQSINPPSLPDYRKVSEYPENKKLWERI